MLWKWKLGMEIQGTWRKSGGALTLVCRYDGIHGQVGRLADGLYVLETNILKLEICFNSLHCLKFTLFPQRADVMGDK